MNLIDPNLKEIIERTKLKRLDDKALNLVSNADWIEAIEKSLVRQG